MYKNVLNQYTLALILLFPSCFFLFQAPARLSLTDQLQTRGELRDDYGPLEPIGNKNAAFISQKPRLTFNYNSSKLIFYTFIQDVKLWEQDAFTISNADDNKLGLHEAWAEIVLPNKKDSDFKASPQSAIQHQTPNFNNRIYYLINFRS